MPEVLAALITFIAVAIIGYLYSQLLKSHKPMGRRPELVAAIIGAVAVIIAAVIGIWPQIPKPQLTPVPTSVAVPATGLEAELAKANIILTEVAGKRSQVQEWLISDGQYYAMAQSCITVLAGKRVIDPVPLDVIVVKYRVNTLKGRPDSNFPSEQYRDMEGVKDAIFKTWKERHADFPQKSFDEIVQVQK